MTRLVRTHCRWVYVHTSVVTGWQLKGTSPHARSARFMYEVTGHYQTWSLARGQPRNKARANELTNWLPPLSCSLLELGLLRSPDNETLAGPRWLLNCPPAGGIPPGGLQQNAAVRQPSWTAEAGTWACPEGVPHPSLVPDPWAGPAILASGLAPPAGCLERERELPIVH